MDTDRDTDRDRDIDSDTDPFKCGKYKQIKIILAGYQTL
jgi:hypothetical protein